jgi:ornithine cyclodeaminase/alanine dehydrogenase-like protein (mu-crystallin family)
VAGYTATAGGFAANETLNVGCIGTGGRCQALMKAFKDVPGTRITAVADIWDDNREAGRKLALRLLEVSRGHPLILTRLGALAADAAKSKGISSVVFDRSGARYHGKVKALADAAREAGLEF